jgi:phage regulator Rha-like protein
MNDIVQLTTADVSRAIPVTNSLAVSTLYEVEHKSVTDLIKRYEEDFKELGELTRFEIAPVLKQRKSTGYNLNEDQFYLLVTYMKNTLIARRAKVQFVKAFSKIKRELLARVETRKIGKAARVSITDAINGHVSENGNFKRFAYSNYTKLVYKRVLGMDVKHAKEERGVPDGGNLRDFLTIEELDRVQELESKIAGFIEVSDTDGKDDKQIYQMVKNWIDSRSNP